jgi:hypothetical protein
MLHQRAETEADSLIRSDARHVRKPRAAAAMRTKERASTNV